MLMDKLYTLKNFRVHQQKLEATVEIDAQHPIFAGHFPGQPVLPGVCMVQMMKELLQKAVGKELVLGEASQCKFLSMVDPGQTPSLQAVIDFDTPEDQPLGMSAQLKTHTGIVFKMQAKWTIKG